MIPSFADQFLHQDFIWGKVIRDDLRNVKRNSFTKIHLLLFLVLALVLTRYQKDCSKNISHVVSGMAMSETNDTKIQKKSKEVEQMKEPEPENHLMSFMCPDVCSVVHSYLGSEE